MENKRSKGSYYTPTTIAEFLVKHVSKKVRTSNIRILEPSAGDGVFIDSLYKDESLRNKIRQVVAVEREVLELEKIKNKTTDKTFTGIHADFLNFQNDDTSKFHIVIGNPPYIKKSSLEANQIDLCENIHRHFTQLSKNKINNIWTAFLVRSIEFVDDEGILALVLPSELLQVNFAAELRRLILDEFERVEIFTFNELLFKDCKGQDTIILVAEKKSENAGVFYCHIDKAETLPTQEIKLIENIKIRDAKWNHHHLTSDEITLLQRLKEKLLVVDHYCTSKAGIVTAANDYFIVNQQTVEFYKLHNYVKSIIQKGAFVNGSVTFLDDDFSGLVEQNKPAYLVDLNDTAGFSPDHPIFKYLNKGLDSKIHERYKCKLRKNWYEVPNVGSPAEAFFFRRSNEYPKLIKNTAGVLATDSAYTVNMRDTFEINNLIFSFYNSLTLAFAELQGRYYGGGVLELTPNEYKKLPIPYVDVKQNEFQTFAKNFKIKASIGNICLQNDARILKSIDSNIDADTIAKLAAIRTKLQQWRLKTK